MQQVGSQQRVINVEHHFHVVQRLEEIVRSQEERIRILIAERRSHLLEIERLRERALVQERKLDYLECREGYYRSLVEDIAKIAGILFPNAYMMPFGSSWIRPRLYVDAMVYPWREHWEGPYDPKVLCPIVTGVEKVMPWMHPGPNPLITLVPMNYGGGMIQVLLLKREDSREFIDFGDSRNVMGNDLAGLLLKTEGVKLESETIFRHDDSRPGESLANSSSTTDSAWYQHQEIKVFPCEDMKTSLYMRDLQTKGQVEWCQLSPELEFLLPAHQQGLVFNAIFRFAINRYQ